MAAKRGRPKRRRRPGRPQYAASEKERKEVLVLAGVGIPQVTIASIFGISHMTLRKHFAEELRHGAEKATAKVGGFLYQKATGQLGHDHAAVTAAIFWLKARAGWKDRQVLEHQNPDGTGLFDDWPAERLLPASRRAVEVLEWQAKRAKPRAKAAG